MGRTTWLGLLDSFGKDVTEVGTHSKARGDLGLDAKAVVIGKALLVRSQVADAVNSRIPCICTCLIAKGVTRKSHSSRYEGNQLRFFIRHQVEYHVVEEVMHATVQPDGSAGEILPAQ